MDKNDKVVCVDDNWTPGIERVYKQLPIKDQTYFIREVLPGQDVDALVMDCHEKRVPALLLVGIVNDKNSRGLEHGFSARRFRKLDEASRVNEEVETLIAIK
jgi:hypothetical protein